MGYQTHREFQKPLWSYRMPGGGPDAQQLDKLVRHVEELARKAVAQRTRPPEGHSLRAAAVAACEYITGEVWAEIFDISQFVIARLSRKPRRLHFLGGELRGKRPGSAYSAA
jgi:hypothetical protein